MLAKIVSLIDLGYRGQGLAHFSNETKRWTTKHYTLGENMNHKEKENEILLG